MLNPEMTPTTEETLYNDAKKIYTTYLDPESIDFLNLPMYISQGMKESKYRYFYVCFLISFLFFHFFWVKLVLDLGPEKVQELRTSRPIYDAHREAHLLLENTWLPSFHHTYQVITNSFK